MMAAAFGPFLIVGVLIGEVEEGFSATR